MTFHKSQIFFFILSAFILGVFTASIRPASYATILILLILAVLILTASIYRKTFDDTPKGVNRRRLGATIGLAIMFLAAGLWYFNHYNLRHSYLKEVADRDISVILRGYVNSEPTFSEKSSKFVFSVKQIILPKYGIYADEKILIIAPRYPEYSYGDVLKIEAIVQLPQNFDDFDYVTYLKKEGVTATAFYPKINKDEKLKLTLGDRAEVSIYEALFKIKNKFETVINKSIAEPNASFINGILLGSRQNIPEDLKNNFAKTSTSHILAISGYNITIISEILLGIFVLFMVRRKAFWLSVVAIILFTILTGASASVIRAAIMGLLLLFANGYGRLYDAKISIVLAATLMILINPFVLVFDIGFQLSFLALIGIVYLYPILNMLTKKWPGLANLKETALMTLSAQIFVFPLLIYYFKTFSTVSLPVNILVLPFVPAAMLLGFLTGIAGIILPWLGKIFGLVAWAVTTYQIKIIEFFGSLSFASLNISTSWWPMGLVYLFIILLLVFLSKKYVREL
jgi:competence protein ComEC